MHDFAQVAPGGAEITRWSSHRRQHCLRTNIAWWFSDANAVRHRNRCAYDMEALKKDPCLAACVRQWRQSSLVVMTHAVVVRSEGHQSTGCRELWSSAGAEIEDAGRSESHTSSLELTDYVPSHFIV